MCYKLSSHIGTQSLGIISEIMLSPLAALINHQIPQGLPISFVQCKDSKALHLTKACTCFYEVTFTCTCTCLFFLRKSLTFFFFFFDYAIISFPPRKAELLCQPDYRVLMGTPQIKHESKTDSKTAQHERKHPALYRPPWKCIS